MTAWMRRPPVKGSTLCDLCRDGWPRWMPNDGGKGHHDLPEPAGSFTCNDMTGVATVGYPAHAKRLNDALTPTGRRASQPAYQFPDRPLMPTEPAVFDDRALARDCWLLVPGCPWWVGPAMAAAVVFVVMAILK